MVFTTKSRIAQSYAVLILAGEMTIDDVPNVGNLREIVLEILGAEPQPTA
ncbi:CD1375 family protein [Exiguobacterium sp. s181]|nr:CD1375 family protein [Exiguobacterium sp. s181]